VIAASYRNVPSLEAMSSRIARSSPSKVDAFSPGTFRRFDDDRASVGICGGLDAAGDGGRVDAAHAEHGVRRPAGQS
jgi:hypothetical protein